MKRFWLLFFILFNFLLPAQDDSERRFVSFGTMQGLSSSEVLCAFSDARGFVWMGTLDGLNRFDGHDFISYKHLRGDSTSLPHNSISDIAAFSENELLVGTNSGIVIFNVWSGKCRPMPFTKSCAADPPCNKFYTDNEGNTWAWSVYALYRWDKTAKAFSKVLSCDNSSQRPDRISDFMRDRRGQYWIGSFNGLYRIEPSNGNLKRYAPDTARSLCLVNSMFEDAAGRFWCASWGKAFMLFDREKENFKSYRWDQNPVNPSATNIVYNFIETKTASGLQIWASTNIGLACIDGNRDSIYASGIQFFRHDESKRESICSDDARALAKGNSGEIWICTGNGVSAIIPAMQAFHHFAPDVKGRVMQLRNDGDGNFFACTWYGDGLQLQQNSGKRIYAWKRVPEDSKTLQNMQVSDVIRSSDSTIWVATFGGLSHGDAAGRKFEKFHAVPDDPFSVSSERITCLDQDDSGNVWCGTYGSGIDVYLAREKVFAHFGSTGKGNDLLPHPLVWDVLCVPGGETWIATNNGIAFYNQSSRRMQGFTKISLGRDSMQTGICYSIFRDSKGVLWFGSENGLIARDRNGNYRLFDEENGLSGNIISSVAEDGDGQLWVSTNGGLSAIDADRKIIRNFSEAGGLPLNSGFSALLRSNNHIIAGGENFCFRFDPSEMKLPAIAPSVYITGINTTSGQLDFSENPANHSALALDWNQNTISFDFVSPGITTTAFIQYQYRLAGTTDWLNSGNRHFASFAGLAPGTYRFEVRTLLAGKAGNVTAFSFVIAPPFWKTWWFIGTCFLVVVLLVAWFVRRESTRKIREQLLRLEKQQAVERERNRISQDMHDDLGSGLTRIAILSEVVKKKIDKPEQIGTHVETISEAARGLVDSLNEIIWSLNPENDKLVNLLAYIREYASQYLDSFGIMLDAEIDDQPVGAELSEQKRRFLFLVVKEALHNIAKHAGATQVKLKVHHTANALEVVVADNGKGFDPANIRAGGNGLKNMRTRMQNIGASYNLDSETGKGTTVTIRIPFGEITS